MGTREFIKTLLLSDFRSYTVLDIAFDGRPVVLYGENGAGKTNLLEAVSLLSPGRGLRRAKLVDFARRDGEVACENWAVAAKLGDSDVKIGTGGIDGVPTRRKMRMDGKPASGPDLARHISVNWLTPAQDRLFVGPSSDRRKFFDRLCLVHAPKHGRASLTYDRSRAERGRLFADGIDDAYWFDALETDMAESGAKIAQARWQVLEMLRTEIDNRAGSSFPQADLALEGEAEALYAAGADEYDVTEYIKAALAKDRALDARAGRTLRGVHKSDLLVTHRAKAMQAAYCSTGEQKALLIGLVLAHARTQADKPPLLLLDEVAAHLDEHRRAALIEELLELNTQVFLTGTDADLFKAFAGRAQVFEVKDGKIYLQPG
ncbi:MAG: DNA replication/repair protein RecF [Robiginitomaculum sp.]|nr:DNA replication/repair protein RecF [Robiginitomaculum sp.]